MVLRDRRARAILAAACAAGIAVTSSVAVGQEAPAPARTPQATRAQAPRTATAVTPPGAAAAAATSLEATEAAEAAAEAGTAARAPWNDLQQAEAVAGALDGRQQRQRRAAWLGIGLSCTRCSYHTEGKSLSRWVFNEPPVLYSVDPGSPADRGGLRTGDTLVAIDGQALVSSRGGQAFANLVPGTVVRLSYRRDGHERTTTVRPAEPPTQRDLADAEAARSADLARALSGSSRRDMERAQRDLERAQAELTRNLGKRLSDSSMRVLRGYLEQAQRALESTPSPLLALPLPRAVPAPSAPAAVPSPGGQPTAPAPNVAPVPGVAPPRGLGWAVAPPGGLRYSGRLGSALIEARRPGGVDVLETGDSEVVLTGGDLSVRIALEPGRGAAERPVTAAAGWATARSSGGDVAHGIQGYLVNPRLAEALGARSGVLVLDVARSSHADSLGIVPGDVLVTLNDRPVVSITPDRLYGDRQLRAATPRPGAATAEVVRSHVRRTLLLQVGPGPRRRAPTPPPTRRP